MTRSSSRTNRIPDPEHVKELLSRFASVRLDVSLDDIDDRDRSALQRLAEAGPWIDRIYWKQRSGADSSLERVLADAHCEGSADVSRLVQLNFGPWDSFDDDRPFLGSERRPPGGGLYPPNLSREDFERHLARHPEDRTSFLSHTTLIRRRAGRLIAVPYAETYRVELKAVANKLSEAAKLASDETFRHFLKARASDLVTESLDASETLWIRNESGPIDIAIGPYEVYDDDLLGLKASFEMTVLIRHPMTRRLDDLQAVAGDVDSRLPGAMAPATYHRRLAVGIFDVVFAAGMTNVGGKAIAATLPNDEGIRSRVGARLLLFRNVISAKFDPILKPIAERVLRTDQVSLVREDAFLEHTLLHELAHAMATDYVLQNGAKTGTTINESLREHYSTIDECRADLVAMVTLDLLTTRGVFGADMRAAAAVTFVANGIRSLRFGSGDSYSKGAAITLSHLLRSGAVKLGSDRRLSVDVSGVHREVARLAGDVQRIATHGDYEAAARLINELGSMPHEIEGIRRTLADIPIDIEFVFGGSDDLL